MLKTRGGVILTLCPNTFLGKNGQEVEVVVQEILNKKDLAQSGIPTIADDGRLLETGGMLRVTTIPDLKINPDCPINAKVPTSLKTKNMQLFVADVENGEVEWKLVGPLEQPKIPENLMNGERLFLQNCASCHNKDMVSAMTGPALNCVFAYRTRDWLVEFTRNSQKMIAKGDKTAKCIWQRWKGAGAMNAFENLTDKQINEIYDYIDAARDRDCECRTFQCDHEYNCINDSIIRPGIAQPRDYLFFQFSILDKKFINIDAFLGTGQQEVEPFFINFDTDEPMEAYLIFQERNSLCPLVKEDSQYIMMNGSGKNEIPLPVGEDVKIIAFTRDRSKQRFGAEKTVTIGQQNRYEIKLTPMDNEDFKYMLKENGFVESCCQYGHMEVSN